MNRLKHVLARETRRNHIHQRMAILWSPLPMRVREDLPSQGSFIRPRSREWTMEIAQITRERLACKAENQERQSLASWLQSQ